MRRLFKRIAIAALLIFSALGIGGYAYVHSLDLDNLPKANPQAGPDSVGYANPMPAPQRGRILAVVSSAATLLNGRATGYELTELSRAWWVFRANGYHVDIASPRGGDAPKVIDQDDITDADYAFLNDAQAQAQMANTLTLANVNPADYAAIYFVGGKGTMLDFPGNPDIARLLRDIAPRGVVGAVCHGPAALLDVRLDDGTLLLAGHTVSGFSNAEERFFDKEPEKKLGFLLQNALGKQAAHYSEGLMYLQHSVVSDRLITGQNPWSTWAVAESMIAALGHMPVARRISAEEHSVTVLLTYHRDGLGAARAKKAELGDIDKRLLLMHAIVAAMDWRPIDAIAIARLAE